VAPASFRPRLTATPLPSHNGADSLARRGLSPPRTSTCPAYRKRRRNPFSALPVELASGQLRNRNCRLRLPPVSEEPPVPSQSLTTGSAVASPGRTSTSCRVRRASKARRRNDISTCSYQLRTASSYEPRSGFQPTSAVPCGLSLMTLLISGFPPIYFSEPLPLVFSKTTLRPSRWSIC
jgi:hypothetical protein